MSQSDLDLVKQIHANFSDGRSSEWAFAPGAEWHQAPDLPDSRVLRGPAEINAVIAEWTRSFDDFQADLLDLSEHRDWVVTSMLLRGRMRDSTAEVRLEEAYAWRLVDARPSRFASTEDGSRRSPG